MNQRIRESGLCLPWSLTFAAVVEAFREQSATDVTSLSSCRWCGSAKILIPASSWSETGSDQDGSLSSASTQVCLASSALHVDCVYMGSHAERSYDERELLHPSKMYQLAVPSRPETQKGGDLTAHQTFRFSSIRERREHVWCILEHPTTYIFTKPVGMEGTGTIVRSPLRSDVLHNY